MSVMKKAISAFLWHACDPEKIEICLSAQERKGNFPK